MLCSGGVLWCDLFYSILFQGLGGQALQGASRSHTLTLWCCLGFETVPLFEPGEREVLPEAQLVSSCRHGLSLEGLLFEVFETVG